MRHLPLSLLLSAVVCAVAMAQTAPKWKADAEAEVKAAQAAGAEQIPAAQEHLAKANQALAQAADAAKAGQSDVAVRKGALATAEAQLAKNLAKETKTRADLQAALNQLSAIKAK